MSDEDKSEEPTPKKLEDARLEGDVPQSRDFASFVVFAGLTLALYFWAKNLLPEMTKVLRSYLSLERQLPSDAREAQQFMARLLVEVVVLTGPFMAAVFCFGVVAYLGQFGFLFVPKKVMPDFKRINPASGLKRILSRETIVEFVKSFLKVSVFTVILYFMSKGEAENLVEIGASPVALILTYLGSMILKLIFACLLFIAVLGVVDLFYQRWSYNQKMMMTMKEVRDEYKQREGDPHVKARIRQIQRETARARMMDKVPKADVVVANPTHVAVALQYEKGRMSAPTVVAKGAGHTAVRIKALAIESGVPVLEKRELARYLYKNVEIGHIVPESLYSAVAEVLAFVYRMKKKYKSLGGIPKRLLTKEEVG